MPRETPKSVTVVGGGIAGMCAACALAEAGLRVQLVERRSYLGGRASSYLHPGVNEVIDNCQHALIGCYTNLLGFYRRIGVADRIHWTTQMTMIEPGGRRSTLGPSPLPPPLHGLPPFSPRTHSHSQISSPSPAPSPRSCSPCRRTQPKVSPHGSNATTRVKARCNASGGSSLPALSIPISIASPCHTPPKLFATLHELC